MLMCAHSVPARRRGVAAALATLAMTGPVASLPAAGATVPLDQVRLSWMPVHGAGMAAPLALRQGTPPPLALVRIPAGAMLEPHTGGPRLRFIAVLNGTLSYADGDDGDPSRLEDYPAGSVLMLPPDTMHYAAARHGDVLLLAVLVDDAELVDAVRAQLGSP